MLKAYSVDKDIKKIIQERIPQNILKELEQGYGKNKKTMQYASHRLIEDLLDKAFGYAWDWEIVDYRVESSTPYFKKGYKDRDTGEMVPDEIIHKEGSFAIVKGRLTVHLYDDVAGKDFTVIKESVGVQPLIGGADVQSESFKGASSDALKKAASILGFGGQLWRDKKEQKFFEELNYEDPWTEAEIAAHEEEFSYVKSLLDNELLTQEELDEVSNEMFKASYEELLPNELSELVTTLKENMEEGAA